MKLLRWNHDLAINAKLTDTSADWMDTSHKHTHTQKPISRNVSDHLREEKPLDNN